MSYNQKFWLKRYLDRDNILEWFKNYKTFYSVLPSGDIVKRDFLLGEKRQIEEIFNSEKTRNKVYNYIKEVVYND